MLAVMGAGGSGDDATWRDSNADFYARGHAGDGEKRFP